MNFNAFNNGKQSSLHRLWRMANPIPLLKNPPVGPMVNTPPVGPTVSDPPVGPIASNPPVGQIVKHPSLWERVVTPPPSKECGRLPNPCSC